MNDNQITDILSHYCVMLKYIDSISKDLSELNKHMRLIANVYEQELGRVDPVDKKVVNK